MLVSLATNQTVAVGASITLPYACTSVQKVFIKCDDAGGNAYGHNVTVQLGQRTICNGASAWGLAGYSTLQGNSAIGSTETGYQIDLGSHQLLSNENLYVTVRNTGASDIDFADISALVDEPVGEFPVRYTEYSDQVFTAENVLTSLSYDSGNTAVDEDARNIEIRSAVNSSAPQLVSANNWYMASTFHSAQGDKFGLLYKSMVPLTVTFNYPSSDGTSAQSTDRILVASQMGTNNRAVSQGRRQSAIARSQVGK
tara:strand:+ start:1597 stop:2361 length:765 start_codon:yes stop_codon:yes gene_type:complete